MRPGSSLALGEQALIRDWIEQGAVPPSFAGFRRGDANSDGGFDVADAVTVLLHLFGSRAVFCQKSVDVNDTGSIDVTDAVFLLENLFGGGPRPPDPVLQCGPDPTSDGLSCESFPPCS